MDGELGRARAWIEATLAETIVSATRLAGGAGARRYWRVTLSDGRSAILMHAVREDARILPPALRAERGLPFVEITALLSKHGIPVPVLYGVESDQRWILLEDLGDRRLCDLTGGERARRLEEAIDMLVHVHAMPRSDTLPFRRAFDREWVRFELATFEKHGLRSESRDPALAAELDTLAACVADLPRSLCLRDFQSQNLMVDANGRLRVLDYQDALAAPRELDLAALLYDSYIEIPAEERTGLLARYERAAELSVSPEAFATLVVQRKCKDYGRYRLLVAEGDTRYSPYLERSRAAVCEVLAALPASLAPLGKRLERDLAEAAR